MRTFVLIAVLLASLVLVVSVSAQTATPPTPTPTPTPTITPTQTPVIGVIVEMSPGQAYRIDRTITYGDMAIVAVVLFATITFATMRIVDIAIRWSK